MTWNDTIIWLIQISWFIYNAMQKALYAERLKSVEVKTRSLCPFTDLQSMSAYLITATQICP